MPKKATSNQQAAKPTEEPKPPKKRSPAFVIAAVRGCGKQEAERIAKKIGDTANRLPDMYTNPKESPKIAGVIAAALDALAKTKADASDTPAE